MSEVDDVKRAHRALYRAFESLRIERMEKVWAQDANVSCIHPGWPIAEGWVAVRETWAVIFENTQEMKFRITDEKVVIVGEVAWVVCIERVRSGDMNGLVLATNVLRRGPDGWKLVHHHGSAVPPEQLRGPESDDDDDDQSPRTVN
jgi:ketosteroid isomerase-like protein